MKLQEQRRIIELGMTAPNVDNAQPFFFRWEGERLSIFRDAKRDRQRGNAGNYISMVGLGCLVECIRIAASGEGLRADFDFQYNPDNPDGPWAMISFQPAQSGADALLPGLQGRCSDRRSYQGGSVSGPVFAQVSADAAQFKGCKLEFQDSFDQNLVDYLKSCEEFFWTDKSILLEMLSWVRWSQKEAHRTRDGMPWQALGVNYLTSRLMKFVAKSVRFRKFAQRSGGPLRAQKRNLEAQVLSSAALGCIAVKDSKLETMVRLGRLFLRVWVRLNMAGYGVQVMANPAIHVFQHVFGIIPEDYPAGSRQVFASGKGVLRNSFGLSEDEIPAWMFRTGKSSQLPAEMRTLRLPLSGVMRTD